MRERYRRMMEHVTLDEGTREEIRNKMLEGKPTRRSVRPLRAAMAAACVCLLLAGTVLAASPELRSLLWGSFAPYVEEIDPEVEPGAVGVYDGVEGRIVSAVSDGYATVCHVEFRDLEGDRIAQLMAQGWEAAQEELGQYLCNISSYSRVPSLSHDGEFHASSIGHKILSYEEETGILLLEYTVIETAPPESESRISLAFPNEFLRTRAPEGESRDYGTYKWNLNAAIQPLSTRDVAVDDVPVTLKDRYSHVTVNPGDEIITVREAIVSPVAVSILHSAYTTVAPRSMELTVELADGSTVGSARFGYSAYEEADTAMQVETDGELALSPRSYTSTWILEEAIDPNQVVGLWVEGVYIPLN